MPFLPAARSLTAKTIATSAFLPDVMNCFTPFRRQPASQRSARVVSALASEPVCGSVSAKAPRSSPAAIGFSQRDFCAALPWPSRIPAARLFTCTIVEVAPSPAASSSMTMASDVWSMPAPPQSSGVATPIKPISPIALRASRGK